MIRRKRPTNLTDYRSVLNSSGEISIGAYARAQRRRRLLIALAGLGLIGGAIWLHAALRPRDRTPSPGRPTVLVRCMVSGCGHEALVQVQDDEARFPLTCPKCGKRSCYRVWQCRMCGYRFVPKGGPTELRCPRCGSQRVGTAERPAEKVDGQ